MEPLPNSLWPVPEARGLLAAFDNLFLLSYLVGLAVLLWVSWHRLFREPYSPVNDQTDKVLRLMPPGDLRGILTVLRAYLVYSLLVGGLYSIIALAGSFLWDIASKMRLPEFAGLSLAELPFEMDEPAWPLAVSLAFVGVFDRIPKVQAIELTFRRWAYRSIGIPPFIKERTQFVVAADLLSQPGAQDLFDRRALTDRLRGLAEPLIGANRANQLRLELERIGSLQRLILPDAGPYPSAGLRIRFAPMMREMTNDTRALFDEIEGVVLLLGGRTTADEGDDLDHERTERRRLIDTLSTHVSMVHWDMCTLLTVLIENEPMPSADAHPALRHFIDDIHMRAQQDTQKNDRVLSIAFGSLAAAFFAAWIAIGFDVHSTWADNNDVVSAAIDSLLVALVLLPALIAGLATQDARAAVRRWVHFRPFTGQTIPISQYVAVFARGFLVTVPLVLLFYAVFLYATVNAQGDAVRRFWALWPIFLGYATIGGLQAVAGAYTIGDVDGGSVSKALRAAGTNALVVGLAMIGLYLVMAGTIPQVDSGLLFVLANWFDVVRMALVCGLAIYLTARVTAAGAEESAGPANGPGPRGAVA